MAAIGPISRKNLIRYFRRLGFEGPESGGKHAYMQRGSHRVRIPNPHTSDISKPLLIDLLRQAQITRDEWENL
ncbi:MAG TPA: type II toxin-antitoxin system HicA family toxin [Chroococcidiopsis sp.]